VSRGPSDPPGDGPIPWPKFDGSLACRRLSYEDDNVTCSATHHEHDSDEDEASERSEEPNEELVVVFADILYSVADGAAATGNYFEVELLEGDDTNIRIGLAVRSDDSNLSDMPGSTETSYGYDSDEGTRWHAENVSEDEAWTSWTIGDTIGCGMNMQNNSIFFTRNGMLLGVGFTDVIPEKLSPVIGFYTSDSSDYKARIHFGEYKPFLYQGPEVVLHPAAVARSTANNGGGKASHHSIIVDHTPLPWLHMIINEIHALRMVSAKALIVYANEIKYEDVSAVTIDSRKKWLSSTFFSKGIMTFEPTDAAEIFLRRFIDDYDSPECQSLVTVMRGVVRQDRRFGPRDEHHLVHLICAAMLWHHGLAVEALALAEKRRSTPSAQMIALWKFSQSIRDLLGTRESQREKEQVVPHSDNNEETSIDSATAAQSG